MFFSTDAPEPMPELVPDALAPDMPDDAVVLVSRRSLVRVALVAAETALSFHRDGVGYDPMAWMLAPRRLFDGRAPLDACLRLDDCERALLLHGLGIGLDADRRVFDQEIMEDDGVLEDAA